MMNHDLTQYEPSGYSSERPLYDSRRNPVYQIDCSVAASGKRVAMTKRRVRFRFGFSNLEALEGGRSGTDCRGQEHEVTFVWSLTSGKRLVLADGNEVHFSMGPRTQGKFETGWTMRGGHMMKLIAYAAAPIRARPGFRQFDLTIDGLSFFDMPRIYELGVNNQGALAASSMTPYEYGYSQGAAPTYSQPYNNYTLSHEEELAWTKSTYNQEERHHMDRGMSEYAPADLRASFNASDSALTEEEAPNQSPPARSVSMPAENFDMPKDLVSDPTPVTQMQDLVSAPLPVLDQAPFAQPQAQPQPPLAPPAPTYEAVANEIMGNYAPAPVPNAVPPSPYAGEIAPPNYVQAPHVVAPAVTTPTPKAHVAPQYAEPQNEPTYYAPTQNEPVYYAQPPVEVTAAAAYQSSHLSPVTAASGMSSTGFFTAEGSPSPPLDRNGQSPLSLPPSEPVPSSDDTAPSAAPTFNTEETDELSSGSPKAVEDVDPLSQSFKNLVNLDDINSAPEEDQIPTKLTMNAFVERNNSAGADKRNSGKSKVPKSKGLPPTATSWGMGINPSLGEIQSINGTSGPRQPSKEVMRTHAFHPQAPTTGALVVYGQGPPPLGAPQLQNSGFGAGAHLPNGGYAVDQSAYQRNSIYAGGY